jgi:hypothetical protein
MGLSGCGGSSHDGAQPGYRSPCRSRRVGTVLASGKGAKPPPTLGSARGSPVTGPARAARLAARLGSRDLAVLATLQEFRLMTGGQLRRLHFPGSNLVTQSRKARGALQRLAELGLIVRLQRRIGGIRAGSDGYIYGLSGLGHAVLDIGRADARRHRSVTGTKPAFQNHVLAVSELAVTLHEQARAGTFTLDELRAEPGCWRWFAGIGGQRRALKPDVFLRLTVEAYEVTAFIEMDMATESLPAVARKCGVYLDYWRSGSEQQRHGVFPRVWWLVPDDDRLHALTRAIQQLPAEARDLFTVARTHNAAVRLTQLPGNANEGGAR